MCLHLSSHSRPFTRKRPFAGAAVGAQPAAPLRFAEVRRAQVLLLGFLFCPFWCLGWRWIRSKSRTERVRR